jgi:glycosyltransferase involved in cell wall biosynthesis
MKIVLVAPGYKPFPPNGWGAVESIVWDYYENLSRRSYSVEIVNTPDGNRMVNECNAKNADVVHIMYDDYIYIAPHLNCKRVYYTSHYAYLTSPTLHTIPYYPSIFQKVISLQKWVTLNVISEKIKELYERSGFQGKINVICNGAREDLFRFTMNPAKVDKSIYLAKVEFRKGQYLYQGIPEIDFVGNYHDSPFDQNLPNYLGEWDKPTLYEKMTDYGNLVLLSDGEADPLVVKEALIAGLGVVVSECATANLDLTKPYITVIPDGRRKDLDFVRREIAANRAISVQMRGEIREYGLATFSWDKVITKYEQLCLSD